MRLLKLLNRTLPLVFWLLLIFGFDTPTLATLTLIAAFIHELGHFFFGSPSAALRIFPHSSGFRIKAAAMMSYKKEALLIIGGPAFNFLAAGISSLLGMLFVENGYFPLFSAINVMTAASNLLPVSGYDGYRFAECLILEYSKNAERGLEILCTASFVFTTVLMFLSLYLILKIGEAYWIFAVLFVTFLLGLKKTVTDSVF